MTLMQVALTLSIVTSTLAIIASLYGFVRFVRRWWRPSRKGTQHGTDRNGARPVDRRGFAATAKDADAASA